VFTGGLDFKTAKMGLKVSNSREETIQHLKALHLSTNEKLVFIAAKQNDNVDQLIDFMIHAINIDAADQQDVIVTNARHYEILKNAHAAILRVLNGLNTGITGDFLAQDIRECLYYLSEITGEVGTEEVLGHIFKNFCIGK
jgi:tRNA modification GTPase